MNLKNKQNKLIGWIASFCFCFSGAPAAIEAIQIGKSLVPIGTLIFWTIGEICAIIYVKPRKDIPLLANYIINLFFLIIMWYYKL